MPRLHPIVFISACLGVERGISSFLEFPDDSNMQQSLQVDCCIPWLLQVWFSTQQMCPPISHVGLA